jgi:hypothetical protein
MDWPGLAADYLRPTLVGAVAAVIATYLKDSLIERQKAKHGSDLEARKNVFSLGATSHMATVAFNQHVLFCEAYFREVLRTLNALTTDGLSREQLDAQELSRIRLDRALWLTTDIDNRLERFEHVVTKLGGEARVEDPTGDRLSNQRTVKIVIAILRELLRTEELTALKRTGQALSEHGTSGWLKTVEGAMNERAGSLPNPVTLVGHARLLVRWYMTADGR